MLDASQLTVIRFDETLELTGSLSPYTRDGKPAALRALENRYVL